MALADRSVELSQEVLQEIKEGQEAAIGPEPHDFELIRLVEGPGVTHLRYRACGSRRSVESDAAGGGR